jgi:uncharacterized membrane protein YcgQ (UPF0703/DUF1980 family)
MKKLIALPVIALFAISAFAGTSTTTTRTYDSSVSQPSSVNEPVMGIQSEEDRVYDADALTNDELEQERMEDRRSEMDSKDHNRRVSSDGIDYTDRTRTNRERKALNTGSDASDDQ